MKNGKKLQRFWKIAKEQIMTHNFFNKFFKYKGGFIANKFA